MKQLGSSNYLVIPYFNKQLIISLLCTLCFLQSCQSYKNIPYFDTPVSLEEVLDKGPVKVIYNDGSEERFDKIVKQDSDGLYYGLVTANQGLGFEKVQKLEIENISAIYQQDSVRHKKRTIVRNVITVISIPAILTGFYFYLLSQAI